MVAQQHVDPAAGGLGFRLETHQHIEHRTLVGTAVQEVAETHEVGGTSDPATLLVDDARLSKQRSELDMGAMHISEDDDALDTLPAPSGVVCDITIGRGRQEEREPRDGAAPRSSSVVRDSRRGCRHPRQVYRSTVSTAASR